MAAQDVKTDIEIDKLKAELHKLRLETGKITAEVFWYPVTVAVGMVLAVSSVTALIIKLFS